MEYLVILGAIVNFAGASLYVRDTLQGRSVPNRVTFFLWALAPFIGTAAALVQGVTWAALPVFMAGFGPFMIFLASFVSKHGVWELGRFDWICAVLSVAALVLWQITKNANVAILFAILSDAAASIPTLKKCWTHPETETMWAYVGGFFAALTGVLAVKALTFSELAFPLYLVVVCCALIGLILVGRRRQKAG